MFYWLNLCWHWDLWLSFFWINTFAGVNFMEKTITLRGNEITFSIWDLGGKWLQMCLWNCSALLCVCCVVCVRACGEEFLIVQELFFFFFLFFEFFFFSRTKRIRVDVAARVQRGSGVVVYVWFVAQINVVEHQGMVSSSTWLQQSTFYFVFQIYIFFFGNILFFKYMFFCLVQSLSYIFDILFFSFSLCLLSLLFFFKTSLTLIDDIDCDSILDWHEIW